MTLSVARAKVKKTEVITAFRLWRKNGMERPGTAASGSTQNDTTVKHEKRLAVSLYLDELLIKYVNSKVGQSSVSRNGFPPCGSMAPYRSHHGKHTCLEQDRQSDRFGN